MSPHSTIWKFIVRGIFSTKLKNFFSSPPKSNLKKYKLGINCKISKYIRIFFWEKKCELFENSIMLLFKDDFFYIWYKKLTLNKNLKFEAVYPIQKNFSKTKTFFFFWQGDTKVWKKIFIAKGILVKE